MTATSPMRTEKKEKDMVFANPNVPQVHETVIPKGKCVGFQELGSTMRDTK